MGPVDTNKKENGAILSPKSPCERGRMERVGPMGRMLHALMRMPLGASWIMVVGAQVVLVPGVMAAEIESKKDGVEIFEDATNKSPVMGSLKAGETLESIERKGMFWQIKTKEGKTGFVSILSVKHKPDTNTNLAKAINGVVKGGRGGEDATESRARSAVMGVRGLREDDDMANAASVRPNLRAVYEMEDIKVSQRKVGELGDKVMGEITRKAESDKK